MRYYIIIIIVISFRSYQALKSFSCFYRPSNTSYVLLRHNPTPSEITTWLGICWGVTALFGASSILLCWILGSCSFLQNTFERILPFENENTLKEKQEKKRRKLMEELAV